MKKGTARQLFAAFSANIAFFITGNHLGWASPVVKKLTYGEAEPHISSREAAWVISIFNLAQAASSVPAGYLANIIGPKRTILVSTVPLFLASWALLSASTTVEMLYGGRILAGLGGGVVFSLVPMYLGEIAADGIRGTLGTMYQFMLSLGIMFEYCVGPYISTTILGIISAVFPILCLATFIWVPESPYYYLLKNQRKEAETSLLWLRGEEDPLKVDEELKKMEKFVLEDRVNAGGVKDLIKDSGNRKALFITSSLITLQNMSGIFVILSYATTIFAASKSSLDDNVSTMILGAVKVSTALVSSSIVDRAGRRPLMIISSIGCCVALTLEGLFFYLKRTGNDVSFLDWLPVVALIGYFITYVLGMGPIPISIQGELFPSRLKGIATAIGSILLGLQASVITELYELISVAWGVDIVFWIFAASCVVSTLFSIFILPETKGKSFLEISWELSPKKKMPLP